MSMHPDSVWSKQQEDQEASTFGIVLRMLMVCSLVGFVLSLSYMLSAATGMNWFIASFVVGMPVLMAIKAVVFFGEFRQEN